MEFLFFFSSVMFCRQLEAFELCLKAIPDDCSQVCIMEKRAKAVRIPVHGFIRCLPAMAASGGFDPKWNGPIVGMWKQGSQGKVLLPRMIGRWVACPSQGILPTITHRLLRKVTCQKPNWDVRSSWVCMVEDWLFYWIFQCIVPFARQHPSGSSKMFGHKLFLRIPPVMLSYTNPEEVTRCWTWWLVKISICFQFQDSN